MPHLNLLRVLRPKEPSLNKGFYLRAVPNSESQSSSDTASGSVFDGYIFLTSGDVIQMPRKRNTDELWPSFDLTRAAALDSQLNALKNNDTPYPDHGVEVCYRFANFSPWERTNYFGRNLDLGQFERYRRVLLSPPFSTLIHHETAELVSSIMVDENSYIDRVRVVGRDGKEERSYDFFMVQRVGGIHDGYWFVEKLMPSDGETFKGTMWEGGA